MNTLNLTEIREGFDADKEAYWSMRDELLAKYRGKWVAIHKGRVVAVGDDLISIADEAIRDDGYAYTNKVGDEDKVIVTKRRRKFPYDASYVPNAMPRVSVRFSNPLLSESQTWDNVIPDTGSDLSSLPNDDCEKLGLYQFPLFQGLSRSYGGQSRQTLFYIAKVGIGAKTYTAIIEPASEPERLLGREVLNQCKVTFDGPKQQTIFH